MPKEVYDFADLQRWPEAGVAEPPLRLAVFGDPVAHSASPPMHNAALEACDLPLRYTRLHIRPDELAPALRLLPQMGFLGTNLTIPHKAAALGLMDHVDPHARRIGVVNTVVIKGEELHGYNTDGPGLVRAVRAEFGAELRDLRVLVLGAGGGAGRAIAMQCAIENCAGLSLVNRTLEKAHALVTELTSVFTANAASSRIAAIPWDAEDLARALRDTDLIVNCTSVGLAAGDESPLATELLRPDLLVYDTVYAAHRTPLMLAADAAGARSANGLSMLLHQGALSFEIWFQRAAPVAVMHDALLAHAARRK